MTAKKSLFVESVLNGGSIREAAKTARVSEGQAHKWLRNGLRDEIDSRRKAAFETALNRLENSMTGAVDTLAELLTKDNPSGTRLGAAKALIENAVRTYELRDIEKRLSELEAAHSE